MAELSKNQMEYVSKISEANIEKEKGNTDAAIEILNGLWKGIPEPKYDYKESFLVVWAMIEIAIDIKTKDNGVPGGL